MTLAFRRIVSKTLLLSLILSFSTAVAFADVLMVTGPESGHPPIVKIIVNGDAGDDILELRAYPQQFRGGVRVATGDVNGDGFVDLITAPGPGIGPHVLVFNGRRFGRRLPGLMNHILAYPASFRNGVYVAVGDVNGDGRADIVVGPDSGGPPLVRVFDGRNGRELRSFLAYPANFRGGVRVATGDVNNDGFDDIITSAGPGGGPHVKVFSGDGNDLLSSFFAYDTNFNGGVFVAAGDVNGDGAAEIITGVGTGAGPHVKVFDGNLQTLYSFFAYDPNFTGGVRVATGDVNGDGALDIITSPGAGGGPHVKVFDLGSQSLLRSFFAYNPSFLGGVFVAGGVLPPQMNP